MHKYIVLVGLTCLALPAYGDVQTFENDYAGFVQAAGPLSMIDFNTLPDGNPSMGGEEITEAFNYDDQVVHFSAPFPYPVIGGNGPYDLRVSENDVDTWIIADAVIPASAIGAFFPGGTTLCAYDDSDALIACVEYGDSGGGLFVGIVSDTPIHSATFSSGNSFEAIESFVFSPVPEPGTMSLIGGGLVMLLGRGKRRRGSRA